jgi:hypothetical protein
MSLYTMNAALKFHYIYALTQMLHNVRMSERGTKQEKYVYRNIEAHSDLGNRHTSQMVMPVNSS